MFYESGYLMLEPNFHFKEKYWPQLSSYLIAKYGRIIISDPPNVQNILIDAFHFLNLKLLDLLFSQSRASFVLFLNMIHENSIELYFKQVEGEKLDCDEETLAATRRVLKIIIEQTTQKVWEGCRNFLKEATINRVHYAAITEELLYIGYQSILISEFIAKSKLFPDSIEIDMTEGVFRKLIIQPFPLLFDFIHLDHNRHNQYVQIYNSFELFQSTIKDKLGMEYQILISPLQKQIGDPKYKFGIFQLDQFCDYLNKDYGYDYDIVKLFYNSFKLDKSNCLTIEKSILNNQNLNRFIYRPIIEINIDKKIYHILGANKWSEAIAVLSSNALPFAQCPEEWKLITPLLNYQKHLNDTHDKILENPAREIISNENKLYDYNVKALIQSYKTSFNLEIKNLGEIDILVLDEEENKIWVIECKHNRSRFDTNNWRRDYTNFFQYEIKLKNKVIWCTNNKDKIRNHFLFKFKTDLDLRKWDVEGIFVINAPTLYMYNGNFKTYTLTDFQKLMDGSYMETEFKFTNEKSGEVLHITHPYFKNLESEISST